ncbi:hypothetical protein L1267_12185 [Pseudoalteromonas sp. OFAV1]|uniref:hypothetical protein n=1 Tax=Pseudoalteromonas sp. OFAV1 TaxID=2908892 RepID=UPI001F29FA34|nr:hypothetical protein [Pseudoalteromonas sp. OFAV1]MCF2901150.1 hypothetical protein [Pseudoalteromonas sp. OFAV1]
MTSIKENLQAIATRIYEGEKATRSSLLTKLSSHYSAGRSDTEANYLQLVSFEAQMDCLALSPDYFTCAEFENTTHSVLRDFINKSIIQNIDSCMHNTAKLGEGKIAMAKLNGLVKLRAELVEIVRL